MFAELSSHSDYEHPYFMFTGHQSSRPTVDDPNQVCGSVNTMAEIQLWVDSHFFFTKVINSSKYRFSSIIVLNAVPGFGSEWISAILSVVVQSKIDARDHVISLQPRQGPTCLFSCYNTST